MEWGLSWYMLLGKLECYPTQNKKMLKKVVQLEEYSHANSRNVKKCGVITIVTPRKV